MMKWITLLIPVMAISCIDNSPVNWNSDPACESCGGDYCALVEQGDVTSLQVDITDLNTVNLIENGEFASGANWSLDPYWTISGGALNFVGGGLPNDNASGDLKQTLVDGYYRIVFEITASYTAGSLEVSLGGLTPVTLTFTAWNPQDKQVEIMYYVSSPTDDLLKFSASTGAWGIDNVEVYRLSSVGFDIKDCDSDTTYYTEYDDTSVRYYETPDTPLSLEDDFPSQEAKAQIDLDWDTYALDDGCYCLCLIDTADMNFNYLVNGVFGDADGWTFTNVGPQGWAVSGGGLVHTDDAGTGFQDDADTTLITPLDASECYVLEFDSEGGEAPADYTLTINYDTATTTDVLLSTETIPAGSASFSIPISGIAMTDLKLVAESDEGVFTLDNMVIRKGRDCVACICTSTCISLATDHDATSLIGCNLLLTATNDNDAFGFDYTGLSLTQRVRVIGKLRHSSYNQDAEQYVKSNGEKVMLYAESEKVEELQIMGIPEWLHDTIAVMLLHDTFSIDGVEYSRVGEYSPNWRRSSKLAPVIVQVAKTTQNRFNTYG